MIMKTLVIPDNNVGFLKKHIQPFRKISFPAEAAFAATSRAQITQISD